MRNHASTNLHKVLTFAIVVVGGALTANPAAAQYSLPLLRLRSQQSAYQTRALQQAYWQRAEYQRLYYQRYRARNRGLQQAIPNTLMYKRMQQRQRAARIAAAQELARQQAVAQQAAIRERVLREQIAQGVLAQRIAREQLVLRRRIRPQYVGVSTVCTTPDVTTRPLTRRESAVVMIVAACRAKRLAASNPKKAVVLAGGKVVTRELRNEVIAAAIVDAFPKMNQAARRMMLTGTTHLIEKGVLSRCYGNAVLTRKVIFTEFNKQSPLIANRPEVIAFLCDLHRQTVAVKG